MMHVMCLMNSKMLTKTKHRIMYLLSGGVFFLPQTVYSRHQHAQNVSLLGMMKHWISMILGLHCRMCSTGMLILENKLHSSAC